MTDSTRPDLWILQFDSIHHVLAAEQVFIERAIWHDLVPTPRDVHSDCGMVIQFRRDDWEDVDGLRSALRQRPRGVYRSTDHGHEQINE